MQKRTIAALITFALLIASSPLASAEGSYSIKVQPAAGITLSPKGTYQLKVEIEPQNLMVHAVSWSSSNEYVAKVSESGKVTAHAAGTAVITAVMETGDSDSCKVTVKGNAVTRLIIRDADLQLSAGASAQLEYEMNENADDKRVKWSSSDENIVSVTDTGKITAIRGGTAVITLLAVNGMTATATVFVPSEVESIRIEPQTAGVSVGGSTALDAYVFPGNAIDRALKWESSDRSVAAVDQNGVITGVGNGTARIRAMAPNGIYAYSTVVVEPMPETIALSDASLTLYPASPAARLHATAYPAEAANCTLAWSSDDESVATVENGKVTARGYGVANISVRALNGVTAVCRVRVTEKLNGISISAEQNSMYTDAEPLLLSVVAEPENAFAGEIAWASSDTGVLTVDENGKATPVGSGVAVISAINEDGLTAQTEIRVIGRAKALSFPENARTERAFTSFTLAPVFTPADSERLDLIWTSADPAIAIVDDGGTVYTRSEGATVIRAESADGALRAECSVYVTANTDIQKKYIALTFDNGPGEYTKDILTALDRFGVRATFFLLGANVEANPDTAALFQNTAHELGNHTYKNASLNNASTEEISLSLETTDALIRTTAGREATVLRASDAYLSPAIFSSFLDTRRFIGWSIDAGDSKGNACETVCDNVLSQAFDAAIVVFHDSSLEGMRALQTVIPALILQGYEFVTVTELMTLTNDTSTSTLFKPQKP